MKKIVPVLLALCLLLIPTTQLISCRHACEFLDTWSYDDEHHWHPCYKKGCTKKHEKLEHFWGDPITLLEATQAEEGVQEIPCTICDYSRKEPLGFTGLTQEQWESFFHMSSLENVYIREASSVTANGAVTETVTEYWITKDSLTVTVTLGGQSKSNTTADPSTIGTTCHSLIEALAGIAQYEHFKYNPREKVYILKKGSKITVPSLNVYSRDVTITFDDANRLSGIAYGAENTVDGVKYEIRNTITLTDYGKVTAH